MVANAVNLVDGLDGLAAGMVAIAAGVFFIYACARPDRSATPLAAACSRRSPRAICVGFLPWNFHPAKIFMGDTGSMLLGMLVAVHDLGGGHAIPLPPSRRGSGG